MYHRYGRHGPRAWYRWHQRRLNRYLPATSLVPIVRPVVIRVYIPINAERVIFIVQQQQPGGLNENYKVEQVDADTDSLKSGDLRGLQLAIGGQSSEFSDSEQEDVDIHLPELSDAEQEVAEGLRTIARIDAGERAQKEVRLGFENPPSIRQLEMDAQQSARHLIRQQVVAGKRIGRVEVLTQMFVRLYMVVYNQEIKHYKDSGVLLSDEEQSIRQIARMDKSDHASHGGVLTLEPLRYFAVARAMRALGLDPELSLSDLPRIDTFSP